MQGRIEALEAAGADEPAFILIVRQIVRPGAADVEPAFAKMLGQRFYRLPVETEADFIARLRQYALDHRQPGQHAVQVLCD